MKRFKVAGLVAALVLLAGAVSLLAVGVVVWGRLPYYEPAVIEVGAMRTSAEHDAVVAEHGWPYVLEIEAENGGGLYFFGAWHTRDPDDAQIASIVSAWERFGSTVALCESRMGFYVGTMRGGVGMFGEVAAPFYLAEREDLPVYSLEPTVEARVEGLSAAHGRDVAAAYLAVQFYQSHKGNGGDPEKILGEGIRKRVGPTALADEIGSVEDFERVWAESVGSAAAELADWRSLPDDALWPKPGGTVMNRLAALDNRVRQEHLVRCIADLVGRGERVFVVCGGSHAIITEPAIRGAIGRTE